MDEEFKTPEQIAAKDKGSPTKAFAMTSPRKLDWIKQLSKKQKIIGGVGLAVLILLIGLLSYHFLHHTKKPIATVSHAKPKVVTPVSKTVASKLTGVQVDPNVNNRPVTGIMIENSVFARPQSGLAPAGVVFEAVAEGGITRFLALYQDTQPQYVGPVRSLRPYYLQWGMGFDAAIAHVGGSPEALSDIKAWNGKDLDQFANGPSYQRINTRVAPHNVYTAIAWLNSLEAVKGYSSSYSGFPRKSEKPLKTPTASAINVNISSSDFNPHYDYDAKTNSYSRSIAGVGQVDETPTANITPKVVIVMVVQQGIEPDDQHTAYTTIGSGTAYIFQDGGITNGTWLKRSNSDQIAFYDTQKAAVKLNPGQTWISVAGGEGRVSYSP